MERTTRMVPLAGAEPARSSIYSRIASDCPMTVPFASWSSGSDPVGVNARTAAGGTSAAVSGAS